MSRTNKTKDLRGGTAEGERGAGGAPAEKRVPDKATIRNIETEKKQKERGQEEVQALLARTNGEFPKEERDLIEYYYFRDLSQEETARLLNIGADRFWKVHDSTMRKIREFLPNVKLF